MSISRFRPRIVSLSPLLYFSSFCQVTDTFVVSVTVVSSLSISGSASFSYSASVTVTVFVSVSGIVLCVSVSVSLCFYLCMCVHVCLSVSNDFMKKMFKNNEKLKRMQRFHESHFRNLRGQFFPVGFTNAELASNSLQK